MLSRVIRKDRDEPFVYNSGGSSFASRSSGAALLVITLRSGSGKKSLTLRAAYHQKASTVSRGGYGRSSSARGHWGG
ncbi:hypothetical protein ACVXHB_00440 [Escherichia coli]